MSDGRRTLPPIPLTTTTTSSQQQQRRRQQGPTTSQRRSSTIPIWRRSFVDDPDHYNYLEFSQVTSNDSTEEQRQRSPASNEGLNPAELVLLRRPRAPDHYTGIGSTQPQSTTDTQRYVVSVDLSETENRGTLEELQQPSRQHQVEVSRHGYQGLDLAVVEKNRRVQRPHSYAGVITSSLTSGSDGRGILKVIGYSGADNLHVAETVPEPRRPQRPHSYAGVVTISLTDGSPLHGDAEVSGYAGTDNIGDRGTAAKNYERLDPAEVEEMRRRANIPHEYAGLRDNNRERSQGEVAESKGYEGLDPDEVEEFRQRARRPPEYAGLRENVEDL